MHVRGSNQAQIRPTYYLDYPCELGENTSFGSGAPCAPWRMSWLTCTPLLVFCAGASRRSLRSPGVPMRWGLCSSPTDCKSICTPGVPMLWGLCSSPTDCKSICTPGVPMLWGLCSSPTDCKSICTPGVPMLWGLCSSPTDCKSICTPGVPMLWGLCSSPTDCKSGVCPRSLRICNTTWGGVARWLPLAPVGIPASGV